MEKDSFVENMEEFRRIISLEFRRHKKLLKNADLFEADKEDYLNICNRRGEDFIYE